MVSSLRFLDYLFDLWVSHVASLFRLDFFSDTRDSLVTDHSVEKRLQEVKRSLDTVQESLDEVREKKLSFLTSKGSKYFALGTPSSPHYLI